MQKIGDIVAKFKKDDTDKYVSQEFQKYAYELAKELGDMEHKSLYMKLAKTNSRGLMETARGFVKDALNARNKGKLFMWKLGELKKQAILTKQRG
jgi:hypothetical protein